MDDKLKDIQELLINHLKGHQPVLKITSDEPDKFEVTGTIATMQGKKKVDGLYFSTVAPKAKDVRFYFFPLYTHRDDLFETLSPELSKALKGKSCFHLKNLSEESKEELKHLIDKGVKLYQKDDWLAPS